MGFRIRKSKKIGGLRINLSKSGIGASVGTKGARYTKKAGGGTRSTIGVPGTGLTYVKDSSKKHNSSRTNATQGSGCRKHIPYFASAIVLKVLGIIMTILSGILTLVLPPIGIAGLFIGICELLLSKRLKKKGIQQALEEAELDDETK